jgi:ATP-dependent Clp protease ATP-binding subunit ClpA
MQRDFARVPAGQRSQWLVQQLSHVPCDIVQVRQQFRPEFINRIDEFIVFQALDKLQIAQIVRLQVMQPAE